MGLSKPGGKGLGRLPKSDVAEGNEGNEGNEGVFWTVQAIQVSHNVSRCFLELIVIYICPRIKKIFTFFLPRHFILLHFPALLALFFVPKGFNRNFGRESVWSSQ